jgi:integrase
MATFRRRMGRWQVQVRIQGSAPKTRTFIKKEDAQRWAIETEALIQRGDLQRGHEVLRKTTLRDLLERYRDNVTIHKRGVANETLLVNMLLRQPFVDKTLTELDPSDFTAYRDRRLKVVKATTISHELTLFSHAYRIARLEWGIPVTNPLEGIRRPKADRPRERRLQPGEWDKLLEAAKSCRNKIIEPLMRFARESAMRRGEILAIRWENIDETKQTLRIPVTKNGHPRTIPLTTEAIAILKAQRDNDLPAPFPLTVESFKLAWKRLVKRAGLDDLHFHDLRHEAVTSFFERGLTMPEVALISGHRDPRMLFRYTHLRAEDVGVKLNSPSLDRAA